MINQGGQQIRVVRPADSGGLPGPLPAGERIVWQGSPEWRSLALHALHVRKAAIYFGVIALLSFSFALWQGKTPIDAAGSIKWLVVLAIVSIGLLSLFAWLTGRTTVYTLTTRRVAIRFGIALPMTINVPYKVVSSAALAVHPGGTGDIPLSLETSDRIAYLVLWPHARPWKLSKPQPMLRCVPEATRVATLLGHALIAATAIGRVEGQPARVAPIFSVAEPRAAAAS
jgi:hypothetical protein